MPSTTISITINTPAEMSVAEALRLFSNFFHYQENIRSGQTIIPNPETRAAFSKRMIAEQVKKSILQQERIEKIKIIPSSNVSVD